VRLHDLSIEQILFHGHQPSVHVYIEQ